MTQAESVRLTVPDMFIMEPTMAASVKNKIFLFKLNAGGAN